LKDEGAKTGFIITKINKMPIKDAKDIAAAIEDKSSGVFFEGVYPDGKKAYYAIGW